MCLMDESGNGCLSQEQLIDQLRLEIKRLRQENENLKVRQCLPSQLKCHSDGWPRHRCCHAVTVGGT